MASVLQIDPCGTIVARIAGYGGSNIPVPALSRLLGVKPTTLNARFRRKHIPVCLIGRTNYLPCDQALQLVQLHRYALIGWLTLLDASRITDVKPATLKARCEQGRLEGHIDLTKRLRLNPAEVEKLCSTACRGEAKLRQPRLGARAKLPVRKSKARTATPAEMKEEARFSEAEGATDTPELAHAQRTPFGHGRFALPPAPEPEIGIVRPEDYGLTGMERERQTGGRRPHGSEDAQKKPARLVYDPLRPFSISVCSPGRAIIYGHRVGRSSGSLMTPIIRRSRLPFRITSTRR